MATRECFLHDGRCPQPAYNILYAEGSEGEKRKSSVVWVSWKGVPLDVPDG